MPYLQREDYRLHYTIQGDPRAPVLVLSHSLGAHMGMWQPQLESFGRRFQLLCYDHPGHGNSEPRPGAASMADFGADVLALLDALDLEQVAFCGLSLGGMVGIWLGAHASHRITRLVVCSAPAQIEDPTLLRRRIARVRRDGVEAITDSVLAGWFTPEFRQREPECVKWTTQMLLSTRAEAYAATAETVCELDLRSELSRIDLPVLVIYGANDEATPSAWNRALQEKISGAAGLCLPGAHLVNIEASNEYNAAVLGFLAPR